MCCSVLEAVEGGLCLLEALRGAGGDALCATLYAGRTGDAGRVGCDALCAILYAGGAGGDALRTTLYAGGCGGGLCLLEVPKLMQGVLLCLPEVMRNVLLLCWR